MGQIVGATLTTHVPRLMIFDEAARRAYMGDRISTFYAALEQLYEERIGESKLRVLRDGIRFLNVILSAAAYIKVVSCGQQGIPNPCQS